MESPLDRDEVWQLQSELGKLPEDLAVNEVVGEGKTAVSAGGCGAILTLFCMASPTLCSVDAAEPVVLAGIWGFKGRGFCCFSSMTVKST